MKDNFSNTPQKIYIKNMVCPRCIKVVMEVLDSHKITYTKINLGEAELDSSLEMARITLLKEALEKEGFELIEDKKSKIVGKVKSLLLEKIYQGKYFSQKLSDFIAKESGQDYSSISNTFSAAENITIEKYFILQKIERCKELLSYKEMTLSEIADILEYSSVAALSTQFKEITGLTPTAFKNQKISGRKAIDLIIP